MRTLWLLSFSLINAMGAFSEAPPLRAEYRYAIDGDTVVVDLAGTMPALFGKAISVRVAHIDTPEIHSKNTCERARALDAKRETERILGKAKDIILINPRRDKYFRILAEVQADGRLLADSLLRKDLAVPYEGETKPHTNWCQK